MPTFIQLLVLYHASMSLLSVFCFFFFWWGPGSCYVTQLGFELLILLPRPPKCCILNPSLWMRLLSFGCSTTHGGRASQALKTDASPACPRRCPEPRVCKGSPGGILNVAAAPWASVALVSDATFLCATEGQRTFFPPADTQ